MSASSAAVRRSLRSVLVAYLIVICGPVRAQDSGLLRDDSLVNHPTSYTSTRDRVVLSSEWQKGDKAPRRFFVAVPPDEQLKPKVLDVEIRGSDGKASSTLEKPVEWLNQQTGVRSRMFSTTPIGWFRYNRVVEIRVNPTFRHGNEGLELSRVRWEYRWSKEYRPSRPFKDEALRRTDQGFGNLLPRLVANPDGLEVYASPNPPAGEMPPNLPGLTFKKLTGGKQPLLRLDIEEKALYRLDLSSIPAVGAAKPPHLDHVHLYNLGRPVPLYLHERAGVPGQGFELIFYGVPSDSKYTIENRYWLSEDAGLPQLRMAEAPIDNAWKSLPAEPSFPEALFIEEEKDLIIQSDDFLSVKDFRWVWGEIPPVDDPASVPAFLRDMPEGTAWFSETEFNLPDMADPGGNTRFDCSFYYLTQDPVDSPAQVEIRINHAPPQTFSVSASGNLTHTFAVPNRQLRETSNTLQIHFARGKLPQDDSVYFDRLVAHYRRRFVALERDFTFAADPPTTSGWRHYAIRGRIPTRPLVLDVADASQPRFVHSELDADGALHFGQKETRKALYRLLSLDVISTPAVATTGALENLVKQKAPIDYLIVSHHDFIDLVDPLVASLRKAGWRVRVVDVENVYASFSWGLLGPDSIKAFLAHTFRRWPGGGPSYVLFVGDCTSDYRNDFRNDVKNFVPTYTLEYGRRTEKWASEHWFTTLCGNDDYSDVLLGRISVATREDAKTVIGKILRYRDQPVLGPWRRRLTYVADGAESFADHSERLRTQHKSPAFTGHRIYLDELPWEDNYYLPPEVLAEDIGHGHKAKVSPVTTTEILDTFNEGSAIVTYRGHGSPNIWSDARIWFGGDSPNSDILMLRNGERLPLIINLTCNSGAIDYPDPPWNLCISEDFHRSPTGGAVGLFVPTGPGIPTSHLRLSQELHHVLFKENVRALGDVVFLAKCRYLLHRQPDDMIKMFLFLGDPSCRLQLPDKTAPLEADRRVVSALTGAKVRISGMVELGAGTKGTVALYSPKDDPVYSADLEVAPDGKFEHLVELQPTDDTGTWTIRTYCWNDGAKRDTAGWVGISLAMPDVAIEQFRIEPTGQTVQAGNPATFVCVVANRSPLPADGITAGVYRLGAAERAAIEEIKLNLAPGERQTLRFPWKAEAGVYRFEAELSGPPSALGRPAPAFKKKTADVAVISPDEACRVAILPQSLRVTLSRAGNRFMRQTSVMIGSIGTEPARRLNAVLSDESGTSETRQTGQLDPGKLQTLSFSRPVDKSALPRRYNISLTYNGNPTSETLRADSAVDVTPDDFPDLTILADRIRFVGEGNRILYGDPTPTDGNTVFIAVTVKNIGAAPVDRAFAIEAFDGDPKKGGKRIRGGEPSALQHEIAYLYPGEERSIRMRWDPVDNAGTHQIHFRVDGALHVTETNEENNEVVRELDVLGKGKLRTEKIYVRLASFEQFRKKIQPLDALVMNDGETTIRLVLVEYFIGPEQTDENKIGEVLVPQIGPKQQIMVRLNWKFTDALKERAAKLLFSFLARLKGSTQRVTSVQQEE